jgi:MFS family permease
MVGEREVKRNALFCEFSLERHVPEKHLLRAIDRFCGARRRSAALGTVLLRDGKTFDRSGTTDPHADRRLMRDQPCCIPWSHPGANGVRDHGGIFRMQYGILGLGSLAGRLVLGHAADRLGRQQTLGGLHVALGMLFLAWTHWHPLGTATVRRGAPERGASLAIREGFFTLAFFAFAYGVCYGATIALRPAVIADHFAGPNLATVTGLHYTSSVLGPLIGPAAFGYSVDFWNSDLIASCAAAACLVGAGYFFAAKPPQTPLRRASVCGARSSPAKTPDFTRRALATASTSCMQHSSNRRVSGNVRMTPIGARVSAPIPPNDTTSRNLSHSAL